MREQWTGGDELEGIIEREREREREGEGEGEGEGERERADLSDLPAVESVHPLWSGLVAGQLIAQLRNTHTHTESGYQPS